jgi:hypothetical protein
MDERMRDVINAYRIFVWQHEWDLFLQTSRATWEFNIRMDLREEMCVGMDWTKLA